MSTAKSSKGKANEWEIPSDSDAPVFEITKDANWFIPVLVFFLGISLAYAGMVVASSMGWEMPGIERKEIRREIVKETPITRTVTKEVPVKKVIEKPVYIDRVVEKRVSVQVPVEPQRVWIDAPRNLPGCFPVFVHLSFGSGGSRSYKAMLCGGGY